MCVVATLNAYVSLNAGPRAVAVPANVQYRTSSARHLTPQSHGASLHGVPGRSHLLLQRVPPAHRGADPAHLPAVPLKSGEVLPVPRRRQRHRGPGGGPADDDRRPRCARPGVLTVPARSGVEIREFWLLH